MDTTELSDIEETEEAEETEEPKYVESGKKTQVILKPPTFNLHTSTLRIEKPFLNIIDEKQITYNFIKKKLSTEEKAELASEFLEQKENQQILDESLKRGLGVSEVLDLFRQKLTFFTPGLAYTKQEPAESKVTLAPNQEPKIEQSITQNTNRTVDNTNNTVFYDAHNDTMTDYQVRGLSLKDALDLIPRFNRQNIPLSQFIDGCNEAKEILQETAEKELAKLIRMRLYGEALTSAREKTFQNIAEVTEFLEQIFGTGKIYHNCLGELAKMKQKSNETVIAYINRLREIEKETTKAATHEKRITDPALFDAKLKEDCLKFFLRGLKWEIRSRMGAPITLKEARDHALEVEKEFACSIIESEENSPRERSSRETRRVHFLENSIET